MFDPSIEKSLRVCYPAASRDHASALSVEPNFPAKAWVSATIARLVACCWFALLSGAPIVAQEKQSPNAKDDRVEKWQRNGLPLMQAYCVDCHNEDLQEGGLDLTPFETLDNLTTSEVKRILEMVQFGAMPPEDYEAPETEERKQLVSALEQTLYSIDCNLSPRAGKVTVRRLNRSEYNRSIRDLFGMDLRPADRFPSDEVGAGFDNNGDVLSLSPMLIEKYIEAAEMVSTRVLIDPRDLKTIDRDVPGDQIPVYGVPKIGRFGGRFLNQDSFAWLDVDLPYDGDYRVRVRGGTSSSKSKPSPVGVYDQNGVLVGKDDLKYFGGSGRSDSMQIKVKLKQGKQRLFFVHHSAGTDLKIGETRFELVQEMDEKTIKAGLDRLGKRNEPDNDIDRDKYPFMIRSIHVSGPSGHPDEAYPPKQFQLVRHVAPRKNNRYYNVEKTAIKNLTPVMREVFRRPVEEEQVRPYAALVKSATDQGESYHRGTQMAIAAMLVSPDFLFRVETPTDAKDDKEEKGFQLSPHQLASRLSYFLWSSTPDRTLLDKADRNQLRDDQLSSQVQRMLKDPKADSLASDFAAQWLGLRNLDGHDVDSERFPQFDDDLKESMAQETEALFLHVLRNNLSVREFLTADYSFLNKRMAKHYGIKLEGDSLQKVSLKGTPRRGLLSHASVLTLTSTPTRTSPVLRGKWILENVLGTKTPEPPAGVPDLDETETADNNATLREQLELHRQSPTCASCHRVMDQLGFGLDDFDAIGRYRTKDAGKPIDASGALPDGRSFNGGSELSKMLSETETEALARTVIERMLTFAIGRELTPDDRCTIDEIVAKTKGNQFRLADIVTAIVTSHPFRFQS